jgi:Leu/Phe-tRNA-protein transferase
MLKHFWNTQIGSGEWIFAIFYAFSVETILFEAHAGGVLIIALGSVFWLKVLKAVASAIAGKVAR